jgi:iron complex outermembrane receptor protein
MLVVTGPQTLVVVSTPPTSSPLEVDTDPRAPRQPIPAHDGADYLKAIPGFSIVRKGGTDGDPVLRGMAGSRVGVLLDGQQILGGCGGRMDPPTAYVFPEAYDRITVLKGPETVLYAAGTSAGTVLFERDRRRVERSGVRMASSFTLGAFGRHDEMADVRAAIPSFYVQGTATRSHTGDYADGNGAPVHSSYTRWSGNAAFGWTPGSSTLVELSLAKSNGRAAYADRAMDGAEFARDNVAIRFDRRFTSRLLQRIEAQSYYNYIDHVMDNFSLRTPGTSFAVNNPDRATTGGRVAMTLAAGSSTGVVLGADVQRNVHTSRSAMGKTTVEQAMAAYSSAPRAEDMRFTQIGLFAEANHALTPRSRLVGGLRSDWHSALDSRACVATSMCAGASPLKNDTRGATDRTTLGSGFLRYERDVDGAGVSGRLSVGVGHVQRTPDYWERLKQDPVTLKSAFLSTRPEKTTQLDAGVVLRGSAWSGSVSAFYGGIRDYVLIRWQPSPSVARNVDATTLGGEATVACSIARSLKADATVSYVRSDNSTDGRPLAQQPPAEARIGLTYDNRVFSLGALARLVASQDRVDVGSGNIVSNGMDLGPTPGFSVFSINGGYRLRKAVQLTAGVDNVLNRSYAEHISQAGAMVPGFVPTTRVNEPGRTIWLKVNFRVG